MLIHSVTSNSKHLRFQGVKINRLSRLFKAALGGIRVGIIHPKHSKISLVTEQLQTLQCSILEADNEITDVLGA